MISQSYPILPMPMSCFVIRSRYISLWLDAKITKAILENFLIGRKVSGIWNNVICILYGKNRTISNDIDSEHSSNRYFQGHNLHPRVTVDSFSYIIFLPNIFFLNFLLEEPGKYQE